MKILFVVPTYKQAFIYGGRVVVVSMLAEALVSRGHFFFQAEDGIRDRNVTGVQTCALPLSGPRATGAAAPGSRMRPMKARPITMQQAASVPPCSISRAGTAPCARTAWCRPRASDRKSVV